MTVKQSDASLEGVYGGFSAPEPPLRMGGRRQAPRRRLGVVLLGVLGALGLGLGLGFASRVDLRPAPEPPPPPDVSALTDAPPAPAAAPQVTARIAPGEDRPAKVVAAPEPMAVRRPPPAVKPAIAAARPAAAPAVRRVPPPPPLAVAAAQPDFRPAFHCDWALRPSEKMVCGDARLSAYDRQLNRAFRLAVEAGAPRAWLREDQDAWVTIDRERAARFGPEAVADAYRRRIDELRALYE